MRCNDSNNRGSALVLAIAVLGIVVAFGFAMYRFTLLEQDSLAVDLDKDRALWDAKSGVEQAIAELQVVIASGQADSLLGKDMAVPLSVYHLAGKGTEAGAAPLVPDDRYASEAVVQISDECARMNVNLAPPAVLMSILKIDGEKARQLRERLPRLDGPAVEDENRRWLSSVKELAGMQVLPSESLADEREANLTVFSAIDMRDPAGFVNLNTASGAVIEAALGVTPEIAGKVIAARPLNSLEAVVAAAGKDANGFNFKPAADSPGALPKELAFSSRCFRIRSTAQLKKRDRENPRGIATVVAVVQFPENAAPRIVYWNEPPVSANTGK